MKKKRKKKLRLLLKRRECHFYLSMLTLEVLRVKSQRESLSLKVTQQRTWPENFAIDTT